MWMVGDMVSASSSSERSAMLMEFRSAMSSVSSSPVSDVSVLPRALRRLPILGSMCTSIPHIFQSTFSVQVPALLLSVFFKRKPAGRNSMWSADKIKAINNISDSSHMLFVQPDSLRNLPAEGCPVVLEHTSYVPSGTTPVYRSHRQKGNSHQ